MSADPVGVSLAAGLPQHAGKACRVHRFGGPEVISFEAIGLLHTGDDEVLVRVGAAGVGPWDGWIRAGRSALPQPLPLTLGSDLAGVVVAVGADVVLLSPGNAVFARKPEELSDVDAATVPVNAVTAWQALFQEAALRRGQAVLIHGAAGNVGAFAVQFAHRAGLHVVATCSEKDADYVRELGADEVLSREGQSFGGVPQNMDAVIDLIGGETGEEIA